MSDIKEEILTSVVEAVFGDIINKGKDKLAILTMGRIEMDATKRAFRKALKQTYEDFQKQYPQESNDIFTLDFFKVEGHEILAQFLLRDAHPDPYELAELGLKSFNPSAQSKKMYVRQAEEATTAFLNLFTHHLKNQPELNELYNSKDFDSIAKDIRAMNEKLGNGKATRGTKIDYLEWLIERNLYIDARGTFQTQRQVQVPLEQVYISLQAQEQRESPAFDFELRDETHKVVAQMELKRQGKQQNNTRAEEMEELWEMEQVRSLKNRETPGKILELSEIVSQQPKIVILGDPGGEKTTLLRFLALKHARATLDKQADAESGLGKTHFPILLRISEYAEDGNWHKQSLTDFLAKVQAIHECPNNGLADLLETELENGSCLVLLDGLDEIVSADDRRGIVEKIEDFVRRHGQKNNRFIVTSRIAGYRIAPLSQPFQHYTVQEMNDGQIQSFLEHWCGTVEDVETPELSLQTRKANAQKEIDGIMNAVKNTPGVRRLAANPLLLRVLALIHKNGSTLPQKRIELYKLAADTLARTWRPAQGVPESALVKDEYLTPLLGELAYWMHEHKPSGIATEKEVYQILGKKWADLLDMDWDEDKPNVKIREEIGKFLVAVREHTGLFVERAPKRYGFMHLTFEEYYAARHLVASSKNRAVLIRKHLHNFRWEEPILLALGFVGLDYPREASDLIETAILARGEDAELLQLKSSKFEEVLRRDYLFAMRCLGDGIPCRPRLRDELLERFQLELLQEIPPAYISRYIDALVNILKNLRDPKVKEILEEALILALRTDSDRDVRSNAAWALEQLSSAPPEAIKVLYTTLFHDPDDSVRSMAAHTINKHVAVSSEIIKTLCSALISDTDSSARCAAAQALRRLSIAPPEVVDTLHSTLLHDPSDDVRCAAAQAIGQFSIAPPEVVDTLHSIFLHDPSDDVRCAAAYTLGELHATSHEAIVALSSTLLHDPSDDLRYAAAYTLGELHATSHEAIVALSSTLLHEPDDEICWAAAYALDKISIVSPEAIAALKATLLHNPSDYVRSTAARALGKLAPASPEIIEVLYTALQDANKDIRCNAALALGNLKHLTPKLTEILCEVISTSSYPIAREQGIKLLDGIIPTPKIMEVLWDNLLDEYRKVDKNSATLLAKYIKKLPYDEFRINEKKLLQAINQQTYHKNDHFGLQSKYETLYEVMWLLVNEEDEDDEED